MNGAWQPSEIENHLMETGNGPWSLDWSDSIVMASNVDRYLEFAVQLEMHNLDGELCEVNLWPDQPFYGSVPSTCDYYANAEIGQEAFDLDSLPNDATSYIEHTWRVKLERPPLIPTNSLYFIFSVWADIHVTYVPV